MSYTTNNDNYSYKAVCKQCYKKTCCLYMGSDLCTLLAEHKIELFVCICITAWFITNTVLFTMLVNSEQCASFKLNMLLVFGGLAFCLPATIYLIIMIVSLVMYCVKIYRLTKEDMRRQYSTEQYELNSDPIVNIFPDDVNL